MVLFCALKLFVTLADVDASYLCHLVHKWCTDISWFRFVSAPPITTSVGHATAVLICLFSELFFCLFLRSFFRSLLPYAGSLLNLISIHLHSVRTNTLISLTSKVLFVFVRCQSLILCVILCLGCLCIHERWRRCLGAIVFGFIGKDFFDFFFRLFYLIISFHL